MRRRGGAWGRGSSRPTSPREKRARGQRGRGGNPVLDSSHAENPLSRCSTLLRSHRVPWGAAPPLVQRPGSVDAGLWLRAHGGGLLRSGAFLLLRAGRERHGRKRRSLLHLDSGRSGSDRATAPRPVPDERSRPGDHPVDSRASGSPKCDTTATVGPHAHTPPELPALLRLPRLTR